MKNGLTKSTLLPFLLLLGFNANAQASGLAGSTMLVWALIATAIALLIFGIVSVADSLMQIEAKKLGVDQNGENYSIFPNSDEIYKPKVEGIKIGQNVTNLKKGHDIILQGVAKEEVIDAPAGTTYAIKPPNFIGMTPIPKVIVEVGDEVKAGDILFFDKKIPEIKYASPVSGEIVAVTRGAKRSIAEVVILGDKDTKYRQYPSFDFANAKREDLVAFLLDSGIWPMIKQRPYDVVADPKIMPRNIFISTFDTAPLAPNASFVIKGREAAFQKGLDVLGKLTPGTVHLGLNAKGASDTFINATGVQKNYFNGPHPAGNVGIQIHHTDPINPQEKVWTLGVQEVCSIGALFLNGQFDASRLVAVAGADIENPTYVRTYQGANVGELTKGNLKNDHVRYVSGDVLSGKQVEPTGHMNFYDDQITVLTEGDEYELFGWLLPITPRPTISNTFPNFLFKDLAFAANTNTHGEKRAFVVTGQYEKVLPMDIYPQHLMKAIIVNDFERMEGLGIYELSEEDIALCEFVCTSKMPLQEILREGLDTMREQG